jgi:hypothetical protein
LETIVQGLDYEYGRGGTETIVEPTVSVTVGVEKNGKEKKLSLQKN